MKNIFLIILLTTSFLKLAAQNEPEVQPPQQRQPKVITYKAEETPVKSLTPHINLLKIDLISVAAGDIGPMFERKLGNKISAQVGAGVTLQNFSKGAISNFFSSTENSNIQRVANIGESFTAAFKYYPNGAIEEFYFAPQFRYRTYNSMAKALYQPGNFNEHLTTMDFMFSFGYIDYVQDNVFLEYSASVGIRNKNQTALVHDTSISPSKYDLQSNANQYVPLVALGLKIGFSVKK